MLYRTCTTVTMIWTVATGIYNNDRSMYFARTSFHMTVRPLEINPPSLLLLSSLFKRLRRSGVSSMFGFMGSIGGGIRLLDSSTGVFKLSGGSNMIFLLPRCSRMWLYRATRSWGQLGSDLKYFPPYRNRIKLEVPYPKPYSLTAGPTTFQQPRSGTNVQ